MQFLEEYDVCGVGFIVLLKGECMYKIVKDFLMVVGCMEYRGACSADNDFGDGVGVMMYILWKFLDKWCVVNGISGFFEGFLVVGMVMLFIDGVKAVEAKKIFEASCVVEGFKVFGWCVVLVDNFVVGLFVKMMCLVYEQIFVDGVGLECEEFECKLFIARKTCEKLASFDVVLVESFYICILSFCMIVYKGMF